MPRRPTSAWAVLHAPHGRILIRPQHAKRQGGWVLLLDGHPLDLELLVPRGRMCAVSSHRRTLTPPRGALPPSELRAFLKERQSEWATLLTGGAARRPRFQVSAIQSVGDLIAHAERDVAATLRPTSAGAYRKLHRRLLRALPAITPLADLTRESCQRVIADLIAAGLRPASVVNLGKALHRLGACAVDSGLLTTNPMDGVSLPRIPERTRQVLTEVQRTAVLAAAASYGRDAHLLFAIGLHAGLRRSELLALRWCDLDVEQRVVHVRNTAGFTTKSGRNRVVPMSADLRAVIMSVHPRQGTGFVLAPDRAIRPGKPRWCFDRTFAAVARQAGVPWLHPHALRHAFATRAIEAGVPLSKLKNWLGHASITVTASYLHHLSGYDQDVERTAARRA
jgi:integrase